jgi:fibronectin type 3 domain-containing protein
MKPHKIAQVLFGLSLVFVALCPSQKVFSAAHSVALAWTASTTPNVTYNVYRGTASGGPYTKLNSTPVSVLTYTDSNNITTYYYYVVTAVDSHGIESVYSNEVSAGVPNPPTGLVGVTN